MARRPATPGARKRPKTQRRPAQATAAEALPYLLSDFERSAKGPGDAPPDQGREVAFAGRSNAGKSSVLNRLTGQRSLARTSKTPGRTQLLNFFRVSPEARLVDLPGYGYAKTDRSTRDAWQQQVEGYLASRRALVGVVLVMDIRHPFQPFDEQMIGWARAADMPLLVLLNKADKLGFGAASAALQQARHHLADTPAAEPLLFSALRGQGSEQALTILRGWLGLDALEVPSDGGAPAPRGGGTGAAGDVSGGDV